MRFPPMFRLINDSDDSVVGSCESIVGLDAPRVIVMERDRARYLKVDFIGCELAEGFSRQVAAWREKPRVKNFQIEIKICSAAGAEVGSYRFVPHYFLGSESNGGLVSLSFAGYCGQTAYPSEIDCWKQLLRAPSPPKNHWLNCSQEGRRAWLNVARRYFCSNARPEEPIPDGSVFELDGRLVDDVPSFYLALGELIRGDYGYFGADLYALADCISGVSVSNGAFRVRWLYADRSRELLDKYSYAVESVDLLSLAVKFLDQGDVFDAFINDPAYYLRPDESYFDKICSVFGQALILE